jgi:hypothetical protein
MINVPSDTSLKEGTLKLRNQVGLGLRDRSSYSASGSEFTDPFQSGSSPYPENGGIDIDKKFVR